MSAKIRQILAVGDTIEVKEEIEARYSDYGVNKGFVVMLTPGTPCAVTHIQVPVIRIIKTNPRPVNELVVVEFFHEETDQLQTASVSYNNIKMVK